MRPEPLLRFSPFQRSTHVYSVGELALHIGGVLEADAVLNDVWLRGDVVNASRSAAGHSEMRKKSLCTRYSLHIKLECNG